MKHLYFIRHGESVMNKKGIFSGRIETPLTETGRAQARAAAQELTSVPIDCIVASPMGRTMDTANIIAEVIGYPIDTIVTSPLFTERSFGPLEGTTYQPNLGDFEGVESITDILTRAAEGLAFLEALPGETILLVSHGAIGRAIRHCVDPKIPYRPSPGFDNGKVVQLL
jgi:broad specificity phosphatase PhoE